MSISHYLKEIGRGSAGARALSRVQAQDLMAQVLDSKISDLELGAFCLAMRIKGETPEEMAGFLDALYARLGFFNTTANTPVVVIPSYNGARKLPVLTPLLAHLLAREGLAVLVHGHPTESTRVSSQDVLSAMGTTALTATAPLISGQVVFAPTEVLCPDLQRLLDVRRVVGLRNSAHSLVKLLNPVQGKALVISSYTHPEYAASMSATFEMMGTSALLLRGTEGEPVADARRQPNIDAYVRGKCTRLFEAQTGPLTQLPELPQAIDANTTAGYIQAVLDKQLPVPAPIANQVQAVLTAFSL